MKKFFAIAFIAATMVACNNSGEKKDGADTTSTPAPDTTTAPAPAPDTMNKMGADTTAKMGGDTAKPKM